MRRTDITTLLKSTFIILYFVHKHFHSFELLWRTLDLSFCLHRLLLWLRKSPHLRVISILWIWLRRSQPRNNIPTIGSLWSRWTWISWSGSLLDASFGFWRNQLLAVLVRWKGWNPSRHGVCKKPQGGLVLHNRRVGWGKQLDACVVFSSLLWDKGFLQGFGTSQDFAWTWLGPLGLDKGRRSGQPFN